MKPSLRFIIVAAILIGGQIAEAGRKGDPDRGWGPRQNRQHRARDDPRGTDAYYFPNRGSRASSSRHRRRRSKSRSETPERRRSSQKAAKDSPGYEEYKKQKLEAAAQHERRLQAQALASCLEERQNAMAAMFNGGQVPHQQPLPAAPPLPGQWAWQQAGQAPPQNPPKPPVEDPKVPVAVLRIIEAELGHAVDLGHSPLEPKALEDQLAQARGKGKSMDAFITRYASDNKAPPARLAAKARTIAQIAVGMRF